MAVEGIEDDHFRQEVVVPVLKYLGLYSLAAENLLIGTAAQESQLGHWLFQLGNGPARGVFQMEPATHNDIWDNYLKYKKPLADKVTKLLIPAFGKVDQLDCNLAYAAAMARVHYLRVPKALPKANDLKGLAQYWKDYYNTRLGAGRVEEFLRNYPD